VSSQFAWPDEMNCCIWWWLLDSGGADFAAHPFARWSTRLTIAMVDGANLSDALENRGDFSLHQTELPLGGYPSDEVSTIEELGGAGNGWAYFAGTHLCEKLLIISQRFFGIPPFRFYALADGIRNALAQTSPESPGKSRLPPRWNSCSPDTTRKSEETPVFGLFRKVGVETEGACGEDFCEQKNTGLPPPIEGR